MKDASHHIKKLNHKVIQSVHHNQEPMPDLPNWPDSKAMKKKKAKREKREQKRVQAPEKKDPEERNKEQKKGRVPILESNKAAPKHAKASHKKTPPL